MTRRFAALPLLLPILIACGQGVSGEEGAGEAAELPPPRQLVVAIDLSGSRSDPHRQQARMALEGALEDLGFGDRVALIQVHQRSAAEAEAVRWSETVPVPDHDGRPTSLDRERLDAVRQAASSVARSIFEAEGAGALPTTDLLATLHVAAEYVRDAEDRPTHLVLLSDMIQSANGIEMSHPEGVPPDAWIDEQAAQGLLPRLEGVCVSVVGADATTPLGVRVREFWRRYLEASGAALADGNYRLIATGAGLGGCG